jgi:hypothetical protein
VAKSRRSDPNANVLNVMVKAKPVNHGSSRAVCLTEISSWISKREKYTIALTRMA